MPIVKDQREEVIDGEMILMPLNKWSHSEIVENTSDEFKAQVDRRQVAVKSAAFGLIIRKSPLSTRGPGRGGTATRRASAGRRRDGGSRC